MSKDICDSCGISKECSKYITKEGELFVWCDECKEGDNE